MTYEEISTLQDGVYLNSDAGEYYYICDSYIDFDWYYMLQAGLQSIVWYSMVDIPQDYKGDILYINKSNKVLMKEVLVRGVYDMRYSRFKTGGICEQYCLLEV